MMALCIFLIIIVLFVLGEKFKKDNNSYLNLKNINSKYENFSYQKKILIKDEVLDLSKLRKFDIKNRIIDIIEDNEFKVKDTMKIIAINRNYKLKYDKKYADIYNNIFVDYYKWNFLNKLSLIIGKFIIRNHKKSFFTDFDLTFIVSYTSPAGRNYYERKEEYNYNSLIKIAKANIPITETKYTENFYVENNKTEKKQIEHNKLTPQMKNKIDSNEINKNKQFKINCNKNSFDRFGISILRKRVNLGIMLDVEYHLKLNDIKLFPVNGIEIYVSLYDDNNNILERDNDDITLNDFENNIFDDELSFSLKDINVDNVNRIEIYCVKAI